jgi:hypothetical protein
MLVAAIGLFSTSARAASASDPQFRLFLTNGTVLACLGEFARVGDRVVFTLPLGAGGASQLMSLPASRVGLAEDRGLQRQPARGALRGRARRARFLGAGG